MFRKVLLVLPIYLLIGAIFALHVYDHRLQIKENVAIATSNIPLKSTVKYRTGEPEEIYFPSLDLRLPIIPGAYYPDSRQWLLTSDKAQFATQTQKPNNKGGLTLIYGHYNRHVFEATDNLKIGDLVQVRTGNNYLFTYKFDSSKVVKPTDTSLFDYKGKPKLMVLTCTGEWFQNRRLMSFSLVSVQEAR